MNTDFFICKVCGQTVYKVQNSGAPIVCCGQPMQLLQAQTEGEGSQKHVAKIKREGNILSAEIGAVFHPSAESHHIYWVAVVQNGKTKIHFMKSGEPPMATFRVNPHATAQVLSYCPQHGLWATTSQGKPKE